MSREGGPQPLQTPRWSHLGHTADRGLQLAQLGRLQVQQPQEGAGQAADLVGDAGQGLRAQRHRLLQRPPRVARLRGTALGPAAPCPHRVTRGQRCLLLLSKCISLPPSPQQDTQPHRQTPNGSGTWLFQLWGFPGIPPQMLLVPQVPEPRAQLSLLPPLGTAAVTPVSHTWGQSAAPPVAIHGDNRLCHQWPHIGTAGRATSQSRMGTTSHATSGHAWG